jgi:arylsulfatase A-like enzyme
VRRTLRWTLLVGVATAVLGVALGAELLRGWSRALPDTLVTEEIVAHLSDELPRDAVLAERTEDPVREGRLEPGDRLRAGGHRPSLVLPPPARVRFRLDAPPDAALRFAVGVDGARDRDPSLGGVRFSVTVNGRERWSRVVNPAARKDDRRWFDETIALGAAGPTEIVLATTAEDPSRRLAGTPGFGQVRLVRTVSRPRVPAAAGPNLLVLLVDTLRADRLGVGGAVPSPSPTLDALAAGGRVFEQAVAQSSWTLPSVATLLTGLHPRSHGALGSAAGDRGARWGFLSDRVTTWPEAAGQAGITTFGVSTNPLFSRGSNLAQGFEGFVELPWDPKARAWPDAAAVNAQFLAWLRPNRRYRFAAWLHYMEPHDPYTPPPDLRPSPPAGIRPAIAEGWVSDLARRVGKKDAPPPTSAELDYLKRLYDAEITAWDRALASLLASLEELGVRDSTVIVVTSDHGEEFAEHGRLTHATQLYDETIRVPLVIVGPGVAAARVSQQVQGVDLFPTVAHLLGLAPPAGLPGQDLLGTPEPRDAVSETASALAPDGTPTDLASLRTPQWKLIEMPLVPRRELYDLSRDPGEHDDRWSASPDGEALRARLDRFRASAPPAPRADGDDPALDEKLRTLGYVE